ncbi:MAG: ATP-binding protein [Thermoguttaceae bacterium]|nr:ATP-binding protein [Thermoguttaceae bacterium]
MNRPILASQEQNERWALDELPRDDVVARGMALDASADLATVLAAWDAATGRLQETHEALRKEVQRLTDELEVKNRLADLGQMAAHVAHEVRNSLVPVTLYLSVLRRRIARDPEALEVLGRIEAGFASLECTVHDLLHFTSDRDPQWSAFGARELIDEVLASVAPQMAAQDIRAVVEVSAEQTLVADRDMMRRALLNLVLNALDAMPQGGTLAVSAAEGPGGVDLRVADTGSGLSGESRRRAFEPFYTTKPGGTGLGLAIVYRIAEVHGGEVAAGNADHGGAVFTLRIPRPSKEAAA